MPRIKIKSFGEKHATVGVHMGGDNTRRKLEPGEVVEIPEDFETNVYPGGLLDVLWKTDAIELVPDSTPATRPLDYSGQRQAKLCSPTFKSRGPHEDAEREQALADAAKLLVNGGNAVESEPADPPASEPEPVKDTARSRRANRRQAAELANDGQALST